MAKTTKPAAHTRAKNTQLKQTHKKPAGKHQKKSGKRPIYIVSICLAITVLLIGLTLGYLYLGKGLSDERIMDRVTVAGVDVGGMTRDEAVQAVRQATSDTYAQKSMVVRVMEHSVSLDPGLTGASLDVEAAVELAYAYGRSGSSGQNVGQQLQAMASGIHVDILPCLKLNTEAIRAELEKLAALCNSRLTQPAFEIVGTDGQDQTLVITLGTPGCDLDLADLYDQVLAAYNKNSFQVEGECAYTEPDSVDLDAIYQETYSEPVDSVLDPETNQATAHAYGYSFDLDSAKAQLAAAEYGQSISIPYLCAAPETTQEALDAVLYRDLLATYTAKSSSSTDRDTNLRLACQAVNGVILAPGETFDYNVTLGERTAEKGYKYAASYYGSQTINTIGGGICQVSSTIYYCALMADLEIVTRINHGFLNTYVPMGMDATVAWGGPEFRFRNNTEYPIRIEASASGGSVTVKLWGTDVKEYYVKMEYEVLEAHEYQVVEQLMEADNEKGYRDGDVITSPYTGYKIATYRCKYDKQTDRLISREKEAVSTYNRRDQVICRIITEDTTAPSEETTAPTEETTAPPEETTTPSEETTAPTEESTSPPEETTIPEETTTPIETSPVQGRPVTEDG